MKSKHFLMVLITIVLVSGCSQSNKKSSNTTTVTEYSFPKQPSRPAEEGFTWKKVSGAELEFWAQQNESIQVGISETLPGAFIERIENGSPIAMRLAIQIFDIKNGNIEDVIEQLKLYNNWQEADSCKFHQIESNRPGVERYVLMPTGKALKKFKEPETQEPICTTCGDWGMGNSGSRYFEIHNRNRNKALFIEIGQEAPLFDEKSITIK